MQSLASQRGGLGHATRHTYLSCWKVQGHACSRPRLLDPARIACQPWRHPQRLVSAATNSEPNLSEAIGQKISLTTAISALAAVSNLYQQYDKDRSNALNLDECVELLNSEDFKEAIGTLLNVTVRLTNKEKLLPYFQKADVDKSKCLSRNEFMAMFMAMATDRVKSDPVVVAEALLGFIDVDRNGKIEGKELKVLLAFLGFPAAVLLPIPTTVSVEYRPLLHRLAGRK